MMLAMAGRTLQDEIDWLYGLQHFGIKLGLDNIRALLEELGHPEAAYHATLIAGTNGKGSVGAMLDAMLTASGVKTGLFTSPHLVRPNERIRVAGKDIDDESLRVRLAAMRERVSKMPHHPSFFEVMTATALQSFREEGVQAAQLEVGLGGRLDATNGVAADLAAIVSIDLDHTKTLGPTIEHIAAEKGGIIRQGQTVISGVVQQRALNVLQRICAERGARLVDANHEVQLTEDVDDRFTLLSRRRRYADLRPALPGRHQIHNLRVAIACLERIADRLGFEIDVEAVRRGLATTRWAGRLQWLRDDAGPDLLFDGAHNPAGVDTLVRYLEKLERPRPVAVLGVMRGKLMEEMIARLAPRLEAIVVTQPAVKRAAEADEVAEVARRHAGSVSVVADPPAALAEARRLAGEERDVLVTGSLYLIGEILASLEERPVPGPVSM
jgi:dihydrofolate synthase/folylpolyglutamate synthase